MITYLSNALPKAKSFWWGVYFLSIVVVAVGIILTAAKF